MLKKSLLKFSSFLYRVHQFIDRHCKQTASYKPYQLKYAPSNRNLKIIHINGNFIVGGTSQLIVDIIERTSDSYEHCIIVPDYPEPLPYQPVSIKKFSIYNLMELYDYLKHENPELVHIHYWVRHIHRFEAYALWYGAIFKICEELNLKIIQNINVPTCPFLSSAVLHNVFVSSYVKDTFDKAGGVASSVIYPGSDFQHFQNDAIDVLPGNCIGMVYRLDNDKLNANAIEVFISAVKKKPAIKCYIIGGGGYYEYYKKRVQEERLGKNFVFTGFLSYNLLPDYYRKFSVFVAPVHDESFGQVTPFAMSMGLCVAGYNTGALSEILGGCDTLVEYGNIEALSTMIVKLVENPSKRKQLGKLNQVRAHANYSIGNMISQYKNLYASYIK